MNNTQQRWNSSATAVPFWKKVPFSDDTSPRYLFHPHSSALPVIISTSIYRAMCVTFCPFRLRSDSCWRCHSPASVTLFHQSLHFSVKVIWWNWQHISIAAVVSFFVARFETPRTWDSCRSYEEKLNGAFCIIIVEDFLNVQLQQETCEKSRQGSNNKLAFD